MKNIHILPTDKTSRLQSNRYSKLFLSEVPKAYADCINQNIYITSDEEIKEGDWYYYFGHIVKYNSDENILTPNCKKIILTTDQDLVKDGVQAIFDDFLEWFVKNPSCEEVEVLDVRYDISTLTNDIKKYPNLDVPDYKIIIPKEETKQDKNKYSEEEVKELLYKLMNYNPLNKELDNWFENNKNK